MDANRDALGQAHPGEDGIDGSNPLIVGLRVRNQIVRGHVDSIARALSDRGPSA